MPIDVNYYLDKIKLMQDEREKRRNQLFTNNQQINQQNKINDIIDLTGLDNNGTPNVAKTPNNILNQGQLNNLSNQNDYQIKKSSQAEIIKPNQDTNFLSNFNNKNDQQRILNNQNQAKTNNQYSYSNNNAYNPLTYSYGKNSSYSLSQNDLGVSSNNDVINYGKQFIGTRYKWGGNDLNKGVDCSGLTQQIFKSKGINLPRTASQQSTKGVSVNYDEMKDGDLIFFDTIKGNKKKVDHVGVYAGNGKMLHSGSKGVTIVDLNTKYWQSRYVSSRRVSKTKSKK